MAGNTYAIITASTDGQNVRVRQVKENPVIVIPGVMGSRLFSSATVFNDSTKVWDPIPTPSGVKGLGDRFKNPVYVKPCVNQNSNLIDANNTQNYEAEYGVQEIYKKIITDLCTDSEREVYFFSYNWIESNAESAKKLSDVIKSINADKVDLVCHSMGGLVASKYYQMYGSEQRVNKIITCVTPYEGAPKLLNSILNWDILGDGAWVSSNDKSDIGLGLIGGVTKKLKASFRGVAELTPTKNYVSRIPMRTMTYVYDVRQLNTRKIEKIMSYEEYAACCETVFKMGGKFSFKDVQEFQTSLIGVDGYNILLGYEKAYFIIGINIKTISSITFNAYHDDLESRWYESDLEYEVGGDGTVPYLSATIMEQIPTRKGLDKKRWITFASDHTNIIKTYDKTSKWIKDILGKGFSTQTGDTVTKNEYIVLRAACPVDITVTCNGETLTSKKGQASMISSYGKLDIIGKNNDIKMVCLDAGDDYSIVLNGTGKGKMDYSIRFFNREGTPCKVSNFTNVPITENTVIYTGTKKEDIVLNIDSDGDGVINEIWTSAGTRQVPDDDSKKISGEKTVLPVISEEKKIVENKFDNNKDFKDEYEITDNRKLLLRRLVTSFVQRKKSCEQVNKTSKDGHKKNE